MLTRTTLHEFDDDEGGVGTRTAKPTTAPTRFMPVRVSSHPDTAQISKASEGREAGRLATAATSSRDRTGARGSLRAFRQVAKSSHVRVNYLGRHGGGTESNNTRGCAEKHCNDTSSEAGGCHCRGSQIAVNDQEMKRRARIREARGVAHHYRLRPHSCAHTGYPKSRFRVASAHHCDTGLGEKKLCRKSESPGACSIPPSGAGKRASTRPPPHTAAVIARSAPA